MADELEDIEDTDAPVITMMQMLVSVTRYLANSLKIYDQFVNYAKDRDGDGGVEAAEIAC